MAELQINPQYINALQNRQTTATEPKKNYQYQTVQQPKNDSFVRQTPMLAPQYQIMQPQQKKKTDYSRMLLTGLSILSSAVVVFYFGAEILARRKAQKDAKAMEQIIKEATSGLKEGVEKASDDIITAINNCVDPILKKAAANEYSKGIHMRSEKRIKDILALDKLKDTEPQPVDLKKAIEIMNKKIIGMDEVKDDILDFLIQYNYNLKNGIKNDKPLVLCLDGPPGVGKTTISEVLAEALGMHYKKISLAGATGKSIIRGTEPQFVNATTGGIASGQLEGGTRRVLYCLDEAEKAGTSDQHGNVMHTLLSLFDDQAKFVDDNLDVPIDISQSIFILTTNDFNRLSGPLKNRLKKIQINPYNDQVKAQIAKLKLNNALEKYKLDPGKVRINIDAYDQLAKLTTDQGGREVTRNVDTLIKKLINIIELGENKGKPVEVNAKFIREELASLPKVGMEERIKAAAEKVA